MKYQLLVASLVCFLVSGSVWGADAREQRSMRLKLLNARIKKILAKPDKYKEPLEFLQDTFTGKKGLLVALKQVLTVSKGASVQNIFRAFFAISKPLLTEAWIASESDIKNASSELLQYYIRTAQELDKEGPFGVRVIRVCSDVLSQREDAANQRLEAAAERREYVQARREAAAERRERAEARRQRARERAAVEDNEYGSDEYGSDDGWQGYIRHLRD